MAIVTRRAGDLVYFADEQIPVPHAFTTRLGGVSAGIYESLNLSVRSRDDRAAVAENYDRLAALLGSRKEDMVFYRQVHGTAVHVVGPEDRLGDIFRLADMEGDGFATREKDVTLAVFAADCIPILFWDKLTGAVAAVHSGWRGTAQDIAGRAVEILCSFASSSMHIRAAIGPGIGTCCFETGSEVPEALRETLGSEAADCIRSGVSGKYMVDLKEANRRLLLRAGLLPEHISVSPHCTMCEPELFWSHRFTEGKRGSQGAFIRMGG